METLRSLLLCVFLAGAQMQVQRHKFDGKFAENMSYFSEKVF